MYWYKVAPHPHLPYSTFIQYRFTFGELHGDASDRCSLATHHYFPPNFEEV